MDKIWSKFRLQISHAKVSQRSMKTPTNVNMYVSV